MVDVSRISHIGQVLDEIIEAVPLDLKGGFELHQTIVAIGQSDRVEIVQEYRTRGNVQILQ